MVLERLPGKSAHLGEILLILTAKETQRISAFDRDQAVRRSQEPGENAPGTGI
jgi:hypothetical protein